MTLLLVAANLFIVRNYGLQESRWARLLSLLFFFIYFLWSRVTKKKLLIFVFACLLLSGFLALYNEILPVRKINLAVTILAYIGLIQHIRPLVKNLKTDGFQKLIFIVVISTNFFMLFMLVDMVGDTVEDQIQLYLLLLRGLSMITLMVFAFSFSHRYSSPQSFYFLLAVLGLVFSDVFAFISYYLEVREFIYADRFLFFMGISALVIYGMLDPQKVLSRHEELI